MVIIISLTKSMAAGNAFRSKQSLGFPDTPGQKNMTGAGGFFTGGKEMLNPPEEGLPAGVVEALADDVSLDEIRELTAFQEFLANHVRPNAICDVQCMLMWAEWVRFHKKQTREFPKLLLEKQFKNLLVNLFDLSILEDGPRGHIYSGIQFIS